MSELQREELQRRLDAVRDVAYIYFPERWGWGALLNALEGRDWRAIVKDDYPNWNDDEIDKQVNDGKEERDRHEEWRRNYSEV